MKQKNNFTAKDHTFVICAYKESKYLKNCIRSLENQTVKSHILIATSTGNAYIRGLAEQYHISLYEMMPHPGLQRIGILRIGRHIQN